MRNGIFWLALAPLFGAGVSSAQTPDSTPASKAPSTSAAAPSTAGAAATPPTTGKPSGPGVAPPASCAPASGPGSDKACPSHPTCPYCPPCGPPGQFWVDGEYLLWGLNAVHAPVLVSTGPQATAGILNGGGAVPLFGGGASTIDGQFRSGYRLTGGLWLDPCNTTGLELSAFELAPAGNSFAAAGSGAAGSPTLARPFFNALSGLPDSEIVALPGLAAGSVYVSTSSHLEGAEADIVQNLSCSCAYRVDALAGFRYLNFHEVVAVAENPSVLPDVPILGGAQFAVYDQFDAHNDFYGGQVGLRAEVRRRRFFAQILGKIAVGDMREVVDVNGATRIVSPTGVVTVGPGGLLASPTNIGRYTRDAFAVVPELGLKAGYQLTPYIRAAVGYSLLYASSVARPAAEIDPVVNPSQLPSNPGGATLVGPARPAFAFHDSDLWANGVDFSLEFRY